MKQNDIEIHARALFANGVRIISNKYFNKDDDEIKNIDKYIASVTGTLDKTAIDKIKAGISLLSDDEVLIWPETKFVKKARQLGPLNKNDVKAPFPLEDKQYIIINRLLFHPEDLHVFIAFGIGGSGKSTYLNIIKQLFDNDFASIAAQNLTEFSLGQALKHRLICSEELKSGELDNQIIKDISERKVLQIKVKFQDDRDVMAQCKLCWCCNNTPRIDASDSGVMRRIVYYKRNTKIQNPDPTLVNKVYTEDELLTFARIALSFENPELDAQDIDWWFKKYFEKDSHDEIMKNNSVWQTCHQCTQSYPEYVEKCREMGLKAYSQPNFEKIREVFREWIDNDTGRTEEQECLRRMVDIYV